MPDAASEKILSLLAREWDFNGPPGIMDIGDIGSIIPLAPSDTMAAIRALFSSGLVDMNTLKTSAWLTPEGYDHISSRGGQ